MRYIPVILVLSFFAILGCLGSSADKDVSPSQLLSNPGAFEGKEICTTGVLNNNSISGVPVEDDHVISRNEGNGTLARLCGKYIAGKLEASSINPVLMLSTRKDTYRSNETLEVRVHFFSTDDGRGEVAVSGIKNAFDRALINEKRDADIRKGLNAFNFEFKTPSCEECSALAPGEYTINATVSTGSKTFETYRNITLEREIK